MKIIFKNLRVTLIYDNDWLHVMQFAEIISLGSKN